MFDSHLPGHTTIIAELGSCHDGDLSKLLSLIEAAADAGADVAKLQYWSDPDRLAERRRAEPYRDVYRRYRVPREWLGDVRHHCLACGIQLGVTTYLPEDVPVIAPYAHVFKIASFEAECGDMYLAHRPFVSERQPLVVSLGMGAVPPVIPYLTNGPNSKWVRYLHCVSAYPAPVAAMRLCTLWHPLDSQFGPSPDGFSDHTDPSLTWTGALAVAAGASVIEAHLRLRETSPDNVDAPHAMSPLQFHDYVRHIRFSEMCVGVDLREGRQACEAEMAQYRVRST